MFAPPKSTPGSMAAAAAAKKQPSSPSSLARRTSISTSTSTSTTASSLRKPLSSTGAGKTGGAGGSSSTSLIARRSQSNNLSLPASKSASRSSLLSCDTTTASVSSSFTATNGAGQKPTAAKTPDSSQASRRRTSSSSAASSSSSSSVSLVSGHSLGGRVVGAKLSQSKTAANSITTKRAGQLTVVSNNNKISNSQAPRRTTTATATTTPTTTTPLTSTVQLLSSTNCPSREAAAAAASSVTTITSQRGAQRVPTLAMSLRDKDQQIKLLIKERDEHKYQSELLARQVIEWRDKYEASEVEKSHVTSEADDEVVELRRLAQEFEDENRKLASRLAERDQLISDTQFKLDELEIERQELRRQLAEKLDELAEMETREQQVAAAAAGLSGRQDNDEASSEQQQELPGGAKVSVQPITERMVSKVKYEREIAELNAKLVAKEEQMMQLRSSLEMRKNELANVKTHAADLERKLKIESERSERHLKRIDEINLELKACEAKLATKLEENEVLDRQVRSLRQELRSAEEKVEQISLARKKDVDILHGKLSQARQRASQAGASLSGCCSPSSPQPPASGSGALAYKTPTPQDELVRLQMEIRDLKDQLIDREAELDCNRRDLEVMRRKMESRTLEVDCNNQELARRCQDLLEQNRQSEETIKQLLMSTTDHSAQLMRATEDLKEANGKCVRLREEANELELRLDEQLKRNQQLARDNGELRELSGEQRAQLEALRQQVDSLNGQLGELCQQLEGQGQSLRRDREQLADQLSQQDIELAQMRHDLAGARQDLRTSRLQTQEVASERDRLKADFEIREKYIRSRNDLIETIRHELEDSRKSLADHKSRLEQLRSETDAELETRARDTRAQLESIRRELQAKCEECNLLRQDSLRLQKQLEALQQQHELETDERFDEMRRKHSEQLDELKLKLEQLERERQQQQALDKAGAEAGAEAEAGPSKELAEQQQQRDSVETVKQTSSVNVQEYESQIEFLNSVVVDMQLKCDDYKSRLAQINIMREFDGLIARPSNGPPRRTTINRTTETTDQQQQQQSTLTRSSTLRPSNLRGASRTHQQQQQQLMSELSSDFATLTRPRVVRIQEPAKSDQGSTETVREMKVTGGSEQIAVQATNNNNNNNIMGKKIRMPPGRRLSGRPYCDTCQVYDLHHTVYCPKLQQDDGSGSRGRSDDSNNNLIVGGSQAETGADTSAKNANDHADDAQLQANRSLVDEMFREYEQSIEAELTRSQRFNSLGRTKVQ